jgi:hypothetical protein
MVRPSLEGPYEPKRNPHPSGDKKPLSSPRAVPPLSGHSAVDPRKPRGRSPK